MISPSDNPWVFQRDELDLLEEEVEIVFQKGIGDHQMPFSDMEDRVLREQIQTEEWFEEEPSSDPLHDLLELHQETSLEDEVQTHGSLKDVLRAHAMRDPLYEHVYLWTKRVYAYTTEHYMDLGIKDEDIFRAHVNVLMIPIKFARIMADMHDADLTEDAQESPSVRVCLTYFSRTLDSLQHRGFLGDEMASVLEREGRELERLVRLQFV